MEFEIVDIPQHDPQLATYVGVNSVDGKTRLSMVNDDIECVYDMDIASLNSLIMLLEAAKQYVGMRMVGNDQEIE